MNKKGTHVDWVISMGIFIVYIFALFILLRPGVRPVYKSEILLDILQKSFEDTAVWSVKSVPLFIRKFSVPPTQTIPRVSVDDENNFWSLNIIIDGLGNKYANEVVYNTELKIKEGASYIPFYFKFHQTSEQYISTNYPKFTVDCTPSDEEYCKAELGIVEDIMGLNDDALTKIKLSDYSALKIKWGFPADKEFAVYIDEELDGIEGDKLIGANPSLQTNVFVRRLENRIVNKDGSTEPLAVYLQVW